MQLLLHTLLLIEQCTRISLVYYNMAEEEEENKIIITRVYMAKVKGVSYFRPRTRSCHHSFKFSSGEI